MRTGRVFQSPMGHVGAVAGKGLMVALIGAMGVAGCETQGEETEQSVGVEASERLLGIADVGYGTVRFHEMTDANGNVSLFVSEQTPNTFVSTPLQVTVRKGYTNLELFKALLPGQVPAQSLITSHPQEAQLIGRPNADVLTASFVKDGPIEKSLATCSAFVLQDVPDTLCTAYTWGNGRRIDNTSGVKALHVGQTWAYATIKNVTMGVCNDSNVAIRGRIGVDRGGDTSSAYSFNGWATIAAGSAWRWYNFRSVNSTLSCPPGPGICLPVDEPSRYRVEGSSPAGKIYHVKTAELQSNPTGHNSCSCTPC